MLVFNGIAPLTFVLLAGAIIAAASLTFWAALPFLVIAALNEFLVMVVSAAEPTPEEPEVVDAEPEITPEEAFAQPVSSL